MRDANPIYAGPSVAIHHALECHGCGFQCEYVPAIGGKWKSDLLRRAMAHAAESGHELHLTEARVRRICPETDKKGEK